MSKRCPAPKYNIRAYLPYAIEYLPANMSCAPLTSTAVFGTAHARAYLHLKSPCRRSPRRNCFWAGRSRHPCYTCPDLVHTPCVCPAETPPARYQFVPVLPDVGVGDGSTEQLRLTHPSSGLVAATHRAPPLPFRYTRATGSHFPANSEDDNILFVGIVAGGGVIGGFLRGGR